MAIDMSTTSAVVSPETLRDAGTFVIAWGTDGGGAGSVVTALSSADADSDGTPTGAPQLWQYVASWRVSTPQF